MLFNKNKKVQNQSIPNVNEYTNTNDDKFLSDNRALRMDANRFDIFNKNRCDFHIDRYRFACEYTEGKNVIDCASGTGYGSDIISKLGRANKVYGVEIDQDACNYAKLHYSSDNVEFFNASILGLPFKDNEFDVFVSFETIEHVKDELKQLREIQRVLKNGGLYIVSTPNDWGLERSKHHVRNYDYNSLINILSDNFKIRKIYNQNSGYVGREVNHSQKRGITLTNDYNCHLAECFIAVVENTK